MEADAEQTSTLQLETSLKMVEQKIFEAMRQIYKENLSYSPRSQQQKSQLFSKHLREEV